MEDPGIEENYRRAIQVQQQTGAVLLCGKCNAANYICCMHLLDSSAGGFWLHLLALLKKWDTLLFLQINNNWTSSFTDHLFPIWREANTWVPLYLFFLVFVFVNFGWKVWPWVVLVIVTAALTDQVSAHLLKGLFNRPRPCNDDVLMPQVRMLLNYCGGNGSFPSSHATNHFGLACFIYFTLKPLLKNWGYLLFIWAATICYAQVYVGVHYPLDVLGGAVLGAGLGTLMARIYNRRIGLPAAGDK